MDLIPQAPRALQPGDDLRFGESERAHHLVIVRAPPARRGRAPRPPARAQV
jgi:hypothetical protein